MPEISITIIIIILTSISSLLAFNNAVLRGSTIFYPYAIRERNEWSRFVTSGFIHANIMHLVINMFVLYSFGSVLEKILLPVYFLNKARLIFVLLYIGGLIISDIPSYFKHRYDATYRALGASGAVSAIVFASILINPVQGGIGILFLPGITIPPYLFGALYLIYSAVMGQRGRGNVNHDAHFYGALFGLIFPIILKPELFSICVEQIKNAI